MSLSDRPPVRRRRVFRLLLVTAILSLLGATAGTALADRRERRVATGRNAEACRWETQDQANRAGAVGTLRQELRLTTASSAVWICADDEGRLFYHAHSRRKGPWVEGKTALFLPEVRLTGTGYQATALDGKGRRIQFLVDWNRLVIQHGDGREEVQEAVPE